HAARIHVQRIERVTRCHEQAVALTSAKGDVGAALRQRDEADRLALGIEYLDPVELGVAHAPAAPQVAVHIDTEAIGRAIRLRCDQNALVDKAGAVVDDIISINWAPGWAAVLDITFALVGRELHAVRQIERALHHRGLTGPRVETIDVRWQLGRCDVALIIGANAEWWIGEPDRVIGFDTSFGELSRLPSNRSINTVIDPSYSVRVMRRVSCSQLMRRPWRSRVLPLAWFEGLR